MNALRIPFIEAISEARLLKARFDSLSLPQQTLLKIAYGLPLAGRELDIWAATQEKAQFDHLGYIEKVTPLEYVPRTYREIWAVIGRRGSKALACDTPIPTPSGWTTMGALTRGSVIFAGDGSPTTITSITQVMTGHECYRVDISDGSSLVADADHRWWVEGKVTRKRKEVQKPRWMMKTTRQLLDEGVIYGASGESNWSIPNMAPLAYPSVPDLPVDPYLLGCWLGDGTAARAEISTTDPEILEAFRLGGFVLTHRDRCTWGINGTVRFDRSRSFWSALGRAGVQNNKCIPQLYLRSGIEERWALLQGLMDTDGCITRNGKSVFYTTSPALCGAFVELSQSLGCITMVREGPAKLNGTIVGSVYRVHLRAPRCPCRLPRKAQRWHPVRRFFRRFITSITPVPSVPVRCLSVAHSSHLFLAGEGVVATHNTDGLAATITAYEAAMGGHEAYIRRGQRAMCFQVAQDLRMARYSLHFIRATLESSPLLNKMIVDVTADRIDLRNGITIATVPPTVKSVRGYACPVIVNDEVGSWYQESDSANPDYEIYRAALPGQLQFPDALVVGISTPWNKAGLLYKMYAAGTLGWKVPRPLPREEFRNLLVLHGTTAMMENPLVSRKFLEEEYQRDSEAFTRECLAQFQDSISGFIPGPSVDRAVSPGLLERIYNHDVAYVAAIDAGFRHDSFTFTVVHRDTRGHLLQDCVREWRPRPNSPINPEPVLQEIKHILMGYGVKLIYGDQYQLEALQSLARHLNLSIIGIDITGKSKAKILGSMQQLFMQGRIHLLDHYETQKQVRTLERKLSEGGNVLIAAPPGMRDDLALVLALACHQAGSDLPRVPEAVERPPAPTPYELGMAQIERNRLHNLQTWD